LVAEFGAHGEPAASDGRKSRGKHRRDRIGHCAIIMRERRNQDSECGSLQFGFVRSWQIALAAGARTSLGRGLGPRWFAEGLPGDPVVTHLEDLQLFRRARRAKDHTVAWSGLRQRASQWRYPTDVVAIQIDLVDADD